MRDVYARIILWLIRPALERREARTTEELSRLLNETREGRANLQKHLDDIQGFRRALAKEAPTP